MSLYTFVMEFKGGTYVSQITSDTLNKACLDWICRLDESDIEGFKESLRVLFKEEFEFEPPILLNGLNNVWCLTFLIDDELVLVNIIKTASAAGEQPITNN